MSNVNRLADLDERIREKLATHRERCSSHDHLGERLHGLWWEEDLSVEEVISSIIYPRMEHVAAFFDNATIPKAGTRNSCACRLHRTLRFPATAEVVFEAVEDNNNNTLEVVYKSSLEPVFFKYESEDRLSIPKARSQIERIEKWVDAKLLGFVDSYLRLEDDSHTENLVVDPVCGMRFNKLYAAAQQLYKGETYYFCISDCQRRFIADPKRYITVQAHDGNV